MVTMNIRVGLHQIKDILKGVRVNELDGAVKYDDVPSRGVACASISEFDLVKSAEGTRSRKNPIDLNILNTNAERKNSQDIRLRNV